MKTRHIQMVRGQTFSFTETVRDENNARVDLTDAKVHFSMRTNPKSTPIVKLTSETPLPATWRAGVVIPTQVGEDIGDYTVTIIPADTSALVALGHEDPYLYEVWIEAANGVTYPHITSSNLDLYPETGAIP